MSEFKQFFEEYKEVWKKNSIDELTAIIHKDYQAREIINNGLEISDFGFNDSVEGWKQAFSHFSKIDSEWIFTEVNFIPLREKEIMAIFWVTLKIEGKPMETANLFCQTFKQCSDGKWKLIRSYIEAAVPSSQINAAVI